MDSGANAISRFRELILRNIAITYPIDDLRKSIGKYSPGRSWRLHQGAAFEYAVLTVSTADLAAALAVCQQSVAFGLRRWSPSMSVIAIDRRRMVRVARPGEAEAAGLPPGRWFVVARCGTRRFVIGPPDGETDPGALFYFLDAIFGNPRGTMH